MLQKIVFVGEVHGAKVYWDGKRWTADPLMAKRYERNAPLVVKYDDMPLSGIDVFFCEHITVPGPKDWSPRRKHGLVRRPS